MSAWGAAKARRVLAALLRIGWQVKHESGSHRRSAGIDSSLVAESATMSRRMLPAGLACALLLGFTGQTASAQAVDPLERLAFMAGCWEMRTPTRVSHEQWMAPSGGMMLGMSRTVVSGVAREWEALHIVVRDGAVTFGAQPGGSAPVFFTATETTDSSATFANPAHDFPQRIIYRRRGADSLFARIEGGEGANVRWIDFPMRRLACGAAPGGAEHDDLDD
jgi:hypothetical protein